jgi:dolichol-phosphate mannosyltransferase
MKKINIIIPTYNEDKNILSLVKKIKRYVPRAFICIVDDSNNDNIKKILNKNNFHKVLYFHRKNKRGRGSAVIFGFKKLFKDDHNQIFIEMDADFSHRPSELRRNIKHFIINQSDLLIASRYIKKSKILNWSFSRKILSKLSNILTKSILNVGVSDYTNGFRIYSSRAIKLVIKKCGNIGDGFIVLSEILVVININKLKINETHSIFVNRVRGESSVNFKLILKSLLGLLKLFIIKEKYKLPKRT